LAETNRFSSRLGMVACIQAVSAMVALTGKLIEASSPAIFGRFALSFAYFLLLVAGLGYVFSGAVLAGMRRRDPRAGTAGTAFTIGAGLASFGFLLELLAVIANSTLTFKAGLLFLYIAAPLLVAATALGGLVLLDEADRARDRAVWGASILYTLSPVLAVFMNGVGWVLAAIVATVIICIEARGVPETERITRTITRQVERIREPESQGEEKEA
jgi:hypothetical protein